jgi:hypothetical protein
MPEKPPTPMWIYLTGQAVAFIFVLAIIYVFFPAETRWRGIGIAAAIGVVAFAGGYLYRPKKP